MLALEPTGLNDKTINKENGFVPIKATDKVNFFCTMCYTPHLYHIVVPFEDA